MLQNTFIHLPSLGYEREKYLWQNGIKTWDDFIECFKSSQKMIDHVSELLRSKEALSSLNSSYFAYLLRKNELWRLWPEFCHKAVFLDIETTGLDFYKDELTIAGLYDGKKSRCFIKGKNLKFLSEELSHYDLLITFNGARFDVPFLLNSIPKIKIPSLHIDLLHVMRSIGYYGGLKSIEKQLEIKRDDSVSNLSGLDAVRLWKEYSRGDSNSLERLIEYNIADVQNLKSLMEFAYNKKKMLSGFMNV